MEDKLTIPEITYMRSLAGIKTDEELAMMMGKPVELITLQFSLMASLPKRPYEKPAAIRKLLSSSDVLATDHASIEQKGKSVKLKKLTKGDQQKLKNAEKKKQDAVQGEVSKRKEAWKKKNDRPLFKTKKLDLKGQVSYKLNAKTIVWDKPGADINELKKKYKIA